MQGHPESPSTPSAGKTTAIEKRVPTVAQLRAQIRDPSLIWKAFIARCRRDIQRPGHFFRALRQTPYAQIGAQFLQRRTYEIALFIWIAWMGSLLVLEHIDPFGISHASEAHSDDLFQKVASSFYPSGAQDKIAVVLIDEQTLRSRGESWPPRYAYYQDVLRRVVKQKPAAVFMDLLLEDKRSYDDSLQPSREAMGQLLSAHPVPFYLATLDAHSGSVFAGVPGVHSALAGWSGHGRDYPLLVGPGHYFADGQRVGHEPEQEPENCTADAQPTAALLLYKDLCASNGTAGCPAFDEKAFCKTMAVQWGRSVAPVVSTRELISASQCSPDDPSLSTRIGNAFASLVAAFNSGRDEHAVDRVRQPCPYAITIREEDLTSEKARGLLEGRAVLIGQSLRGIHDIVESPVHGQIPGVYLHAMALDNLLNWHESYYQAGNALLTKLLLGLVVSLIAAALLRADPPCMSFFLRSIAITLVLGVSFIYYYCLHHPTLDWLGLLVVYELVKRIVESAEQPESAPSHTEISTS